MKTKFEYRSVCWNLQSCHKIDELVQIIRKLRWILSTVPAPVSAQFHTLLPVV